MKIKPIFDNILLQPLESKPTQNGILLPTNTTIQDKPCLATVIACPKEKSVVEINDIVIFNKFAGVEFKLDGKEYILIKEKDILAIIN